MHACDHACDIGHFCKLIPLVVYEWMFAIAMLVLFRLCANHNKLNITLTEPKINKRENKNMHLGAYGQNCKC